MLYKTYIFYTKNTKIFKNIIYNNNYEKNHFSDSYLYLNKYLFNFYYYFIIY